MGIFRTTCLALAAALAAAAQDGSALYKAACAACHDAGAPRAPNRETLGRMYPERILAALSGGSMQVQGYRYTAAQLRAISEYAAGKPFGRDPDSRRLAEARCREPGPSFEKAFESPRWNGWGAGLSNTRAQSAEMAGLTASDLPRLKLKWAFGFPGDVRAYAQPAVIAGRLFAGSAGRQVYSLNASTGCIYWTFEADFSVRTAISFGPAAPGRHAVYFGDRGASAYALDAASGALLWKTRVETYPGATITGAPSLHAGRLYVPVSSGEEVFGANPGYECCKFRGSVSALDAATGKVLWKSYTIPDAPRPVRRNAKGTQLWGPSGAGVWSSPTLDPARRAVYVTTGDGYSDPVASTTDAFLAFDMDTGELLWSRQVTKGDAYNLACEGAGGGNCPESNGPDFDLGSSPVLVSVPGGGRALVAGQKSGVVHAVDPDRKGAVLWQTRVGKGGKLGGVQWGSAVDRDNVYVALSDLGWKKVERGGRRTVTGSMLELDPAAGGGLFALSLKTGEIVWKKLVSACQGRGGCSPAQSAAVTAIPGAVLSGSMDGHLRAYSTGRRPRPLGRGYRAGVRDGERREGERRVDGRSGAGGGRRNGLRDVRIWGLGRNPRQRAAGVQSGVTPGGAHLTGPAPTTNGENNSGCRHYVRPGP
ncbi:MAG TPA: PQQ-binding-like beta-propeller repeat protein [Bryobacteraceae bacterium]|nr:PQQ-binding-like beta-propeller repeat protein [Bryobacteraceae bacterium]